MTTAVEAKHVRHNAYSENLGKEFIAVDTNGSILARAPDEESAKRAVPGAAAYFTGKDFGGNSAASKTQPQPETGVAPVSPPPGVPTTPSGHPISDALADDPTPEPGTRTHPLDDGTPFEGPQAVEPTGKVLNDLAANATSGEPIKDALKASAEASTEAENAGRHAKPDELQAAQVEVLEENVPPAKDPDRPAASKRDPLDHDDKDGRGGSLKGADSTASKGKANRDRKPAAK
jgi:hypothetical protein